MKKLLAFILITFLAFGSLAKNIKLSQFEDDFCEFLPPYVLAFEDTQRKYTFNKILNLPTQKFIKTPVESHLGTNGSAWWLKFEVENDKDADMQILVDMQHAGINIIQFYVVDNQTKAVVATQKSGDLFSFYTRPLLTRNFAFDFVAKKGQSYHCYLFIDNGFEPISLPLYISTPSALAKNETIFVFLFAIFCGVLATMAIISLYIFIQYRRRIYLYYLLFTFSDLMWAFTNYGFDFQFLWPENSLLHNKSPLVFAMLSFFFFVPFSLQFLSDAKKSISLHRWQFINVVVGGGLILLYIACVLFKWYSIEPWLVNISYFYFLAYFAMFCYLIIQEYLYARTWSNAFFAFGFLAMLIGALINVFRELIPMPVSTLIEHGCMIGLMIEVLFSGFAMSLNINGLLLDRETLLTEKSNHKTELLKTEINAEEKERRRIAEDLHDDLGILLSTAKLEAAKSKDAERIIALIDNSITKIRTITQKLHPSAVDQFGLVPVLEEFLEDLALTVPFKLVFYIEPRLEIRKEYQINIFRISTELLNNAVKHAKPTKVNFEMYYQTIENQQYILIIVEDDGIGLVNSTKNFSLGLSNVESRVHVMNGKMYIDTISTKGLKVVIQIPV